MNHPITYLLGPETVLAMIPIGFVLGIVVTIISTILFAFYAAVTNR